MKKKVLRELDKFLGNNVTSSEFEEKSEILDKKIRDASSIIDKKVGSVKDSVVRGGTRTSRALTEASEIRSSLDSVRRGLEKLGDRVDSVDKKSITKYDEIVLSHNSLTDVEPDQHHPEKHSIDSHDTKATGLQLDKLVSGGNADSLHTHKFPVFSKGGGGGGFRYGVKIDREDSKANYLEDKLTAGTNITLTENEVDGEKSLEISTSASADEKVSVDSGSTPGFLGDSSANGVLRTDSPLTYSDGGDYVTLGFDSSALEHGDLLGLSDDDHEQYLLADGTRALSGDLSIGSNKLTSLATPTTATDAANKSYVDSLITGLDWQEAVTSFLDFTSSEPSSPDIGDRYINTTTGTSSETSQAVTENDIYEWNGSSWDETSTSNNMALKVVDEGKFYNYNSTLSEWVDMGGSFDHNSLLNLQGGDGVDQYYHVTEAEKDNLFIKNVDDSDDITEGSSKLFYTNARVNALVQDSGSDYTIQGDWTFNNLVTCANTPTDDNHLTRKSYVDDLIDGQSWRDPVIDKDLSTPPGAPSIGDRYIVAGTSGDWYDDEWSYRKKITIDKDKVDDNLTDFPVLIKITGSDELFTYAQADGDDILFTEDDGQTKIPHEIEEYDNSGQVAVLWVKTDLSSSSDTEIYMYYGNSTCGDQQEVTDVWDSDYYLVQHLNESSGAYYDSTSNNNDGTAYGGMTRGVTGKIGDAARFDGLNDYIQLPSSNNLTGDNLQTCTSECWFKTTGTGAEYTFAIKRSVTQSTLISLTVNNSGAGNAGALIRNKTNTAHSTLNYDGGYNDGDWHYLVAVVDGDDRYIYIDGTQRDTDSDGMQSVSGNSAYASIGAFTAAHSTSFDGDLDEVRFSRSARSADWISTQYNNQDSPSTFSSLGSQEEPSASGAWAGHVDDITEWDGLNWAFETPENSWTLIVTDESKQYTWNGSEWVGGTATVAHNDTTSKQGGTTDQYYHLTEAQHTEITGWSNTVTLSGDGSMNISSGDITTTGDITCAAITASGIVQTQMVLANSAGSHPSGIGAYIELYVLGGSTCRILPYDGSNYYDLAIGDWNGGDPNIMLKTGGAVGINEGSPAAKLHVNGDFIARKTSGSQIEAQYDSGNKLGITVESDGKATIAASGSSLTLSDSGSSVTVSELEDVSNGSLPVITNIGDLQNNHWGMYWDGSQLQMVVKDENGDVSYLEAYK